MSRLISGFLFGLCLVMWFLGVLSSLTIILLSEERAGCFTLIVMWPHLFSVSLPYDAVQGLVCTL